MARARQPQELRRGRGDDDDVDCAAGASRSTDETLISPGENGDDVQVTNRFIAQARFVQQDAVWTRAPVAVPEPGTLTLLAAGLLGLLAARRRRWGAELSPQS